MIIVELIAIWCVVVTGVCVSMRRATRVPWWETVLLDLDGLDVAAARRTVRAPRRHPADQSRMR